MPPMKPLGGGLDHWHADQLPRTPRLIGCRYCPGAAEDFTDTCRSIVNADRRDSQSGMSAAIAQPAAMIAVMATSAPKMFHDTLPCCPMKKL
jgi:hypothetical protein